MKSFIEFLKEERLRSPTEVLQRAARRYGPTIKGKVKDPEWGELDKSKLIPLRNYNKRRADSMFDKYDQIPHDFPRERGVSFSIDELHPGQEYVNFSDPDKLKKKIESKSEKIIIATHKGKHYVVDGHHAIYTAWARGANDITATEHVNLDGFNPRKH